MVMVLHLRRLIARSFAGQCNSLDLLLIHQQFKRAIDGRHAEIRYKLLRPIKNFLRGERPPRSADHRVNGMSLARAAPDFQVQSVLSSVDPAIFDNDTP